MFLVAGLAIAGLAGIAAAFYFSIRSGNRGGKRLRPGTAARTGTGRAGTGRAGAAERPGSRSSSAGHSRGGSARRTAHGGRPGGANRADDASSVDYRDEDDTGPDLAPESGDPVLVGGHRGGDSRQAAGARKADPARRRVGFRKGADVDEELWPTETFGVSDEQFWDDLAADKPLTTTARTAQQDPGTRKRSLGAGRATDLQAPRSSGEDRARGDRAREDRIPGDRAREDRAREDRARGDGRRSGGSGAYPESRTRPNPATERTMIQPAYPATQPVPSMTPQVPGATQPTETRRRRRASAEEDPLTSAAFALRASGPVDGRSSLRSGGAHSGGTHSGGTHSGGTHSGGTHAGGTHARGSYGGPSSATPAMPTPPHGENYGYGSRAVMPPGDDRDRPNGTRTQARHAGTGEVTRLARQAYPQGNYPARNRQGTGGYPGTGYQPNGYQVGGYPGSGQRAPYDPREDYRRLTHHR